MKRFQVVLRYDVEDFGLNRQTGLPELYSRVVRPCDQGPLFARLHSFLKAHKAKANFAITYSLLRRGIEFLRPLRAKRLGHLFTFHLHPKWDPKVQKDWGKHTLPSCYVGHYKGKSLERLLDMAEGAFEQAFGYRPVVNLNACLSTSTELLRSLERRGYLVQGDCTTNTDYRIMERLLKYTFAGARPFRGGPGGPCYPYAPDQPYRPNRADHMLMGDMGPIVVPLTQFKPGMGLPHQETYQDPELEIEMIDRLYRNSRDWTVLVLIMHPHSLMFGSGNADENIEHNLRSLDKVLNYLEKLKGMEYANYLDVRKAYLRLCATKSNGVMVRDVGNGTGFYNGVSSAKYQSVGVGEPFLYEDPVFGTASLAIGQDNGIAQWLTGNGECIGPRIPEKLANKTYRRKSLVTTEASLDGKNLHLPLLNMETTQIANKGSVGVRAAYIAKGLRIITEHTFDQKMSELRTRTYVRKKPAVKIAVQHRYELHPGFRILGKTAESIVASYRNTKIQLSFGRGAARTRRTRDSCSILVNMGKINRGSSLLIVLPR